MTYKAEQYAGSWAVVANGVVVIAGVTEAYAKQVCRDLQNAADAEDEE